MAKIFTVSDTTGEKLEHFVEAHHDGDTTAAIDDLLFCHKHITALMANKAIEELRRNNEARKNGRP